MIAELLLGSICLCGEAPERWNDFYWENDHVGFRAYGPGDKHKWSGIDVFNKCVSTNVVVHWLRHHSSPNFHLNRGQGMDDYAVGPGRGVGGVALRKDGKWLPDYGNWVKYRIITNSDERCAFELDYKLPIGGTMTLGFELRRGRSLFTETVSFSADAPMEGVEVGVGLDVNPKRRHHGSLIVDEKNLLVSLFEDPYGKKGEEGSLMSAAILHPAFGENDVLSVCDGPSGEKMLMTSPRSPEGRVGKIVVSAGADWTEAGRFRTAEAWHNYVRTEKER